MSKKITAYIFTFNYKQNRKFRNKFEKDKTFQKSIDWIASCLPDCVGHSITKKMVSYFFLTKDSMVSFAQGLKKIVSENNLSLACKMTKSPQEMEVEDL